MAVIGWTAAHTGLPCLYSDAPARVTSGGRVLWDGRGPTLIADALAVPGEPTEYRVGAITVTLTRRDDGHALTDGHGRGRVPLAWLGEDPDDWDPRLTMMSTSSRRTPIGRWAISAAAVSGTLDARTRGATATEAMRMLTGARGPLVAIHSPAECKTVDCDIPPIRALYLAGGSSSRTPRLSVSERRWSLPYQGIDPSEVDFVGAAPVVTWGEWAGHGDGWQNASAIDVARSIAGMPA